MAKTPTPTPTPTPVITSPVTPTPVAANPSRPLDVAPTGSRAIERAADLLVRIVESDGSTTVGALSEATRLPKSTTSRLLAALERSGLVQRDDRAAARPGPVLVAYARRGPNDDLAALAGPALDRLAALSGETVNLGICTGAGADSLDQRDTRHYLGSTSWVGRAVPLHASGMGKVYLAWGTASLPAGPLERLAPRTLVDHAALERDLRATRARGYATSVDELEPGLWAVAAPVFARGGDVIASLSVTGPTVRLHDRLLDDLGRELRREADVLSTQLGHDHLTKGAA
jgi:DNA-binding IclR family transcriptional regulator